MKLYVQVDSTGAWLDYTQYIVEGSLVIEDAINVPTLTTFSLVATDGKFQFPPRGSYIKIASEIYAASGGYLQHGQAPVTAGKVLATGFISNEPERSYLGLNKQLTQTGFQQLNYQFNVTSDEWLLNTSMVPYIPAFVDQTQGQILSRLAEALCPDFGFDVTSFVASGDVVPYYQYDPQQTWSDIAKTFADASRYRYKVINKTIYFLPFGDAALGVEYNEAGPERTFFPLDMKTGVLTVPPVNDALVLGDEEPQAKWDNYFVGDGFTSNFKLRHTMFHGTSTLLLSDDWTEGDFQTNLWNVQDPFGVFSLPGALNVNQKGLSGTLNQTYILCNNGVELGGVIELQHGEFQFTDYNLGIVGGVYTDPANLTFANCIAGFALTGQPSASAIGISAIEIDGGNIVHIIVEGPAGTPDPTVQYQPGSVIRLSGLTHATFLNYTGSNASKLSVQSITGPTQISATVRQWVLTCISIPSYAPYPLTNDTGSFVAVADDVLLTASGAAGVAIYPIQNGVIAGPMLALSQPDHHYQLETRFGASNWTRYQAAYRSFDGLIQYGGLEVDATADITFICSDINLDLVIATQYNNFVFNGGVVGPPVPVLPTVTQQSVSGVGVPAFAVYAIINSQDLNLALNFTQISYPPQGSLEVASLTGASATQLPVYPSVALAPPGTPASQILGPTVDYSLGFGLALPTATISQSGNTSFLSFFTNTIPGVGARIRFVSWANGQAISRVQNSASVANSAKVSGDTGLRSAILSNLTPTPRTSDECELAAAAAISDQAFPQFQGTYTVFTIPFRYETVLDPALTDYPRTGRYLFVNAPFRGMQPEPGSPQALTPTVIDRQSVGSIFGGPFTLPTQALQAGDYLFLLASSDAHIHLGTPNFTDTFGGRLQWQQTYNDGIYLHMFARAPQNLAPGQITINYPGGIVHNSGFQFIQVRGLPSTNVFASATGVSPTMPHLTLNGEPVVVNHVYGGAGQAWIFSAICIPNTGEPLVKAAYTIGFVDALNVNSNVPAPWQLEEPDTATSNSIISNLIPASGQLLFVTTVRTQIIELRQEVLQVELSYGPDQYLEKLLANFIQRPEPGILGPTESASPPTPVELTEAGSFYLPMFASGSVTAIRNSLAANYIDVDLGQIPVSAAEVRRIDGGWGLDDNNLIGLFTTQKFSLPRTSRDQTWYIRPRYAGRTSRFSYIIRVNVPMIPSPPTLLSSNSDTLVFDFAGFVADIYGLELKAIPVSGAYEFVQFPNVPEDTFAQMLRSKLLVPTDAAAGGKPVVVNSNVAAIYNPPSNAVAFPFPEEFQLGDVIYVVSPNDASFQGIHLATNILTEQGGVGPSAPPNLAFANAEAFFFINNSSCNGSFCYVSAVLPPTPATVVNNQVQARARLSSLEMNYGQGVNWAVDPLKEPAIFNQYDQAGNYLGPVIPWSGTNEFWAMAITGYLVVPASGTYVLNMPHDDGAFIGIKGPGVTFTGTPPINIAAAIIAHGTCIAGIPIMGGTNQSGYHPDDAWSVTFAAPGNYLFEINYAQWYNEQMLALLHGGGSIFPGNLATPAITGAPWGLGWFDYGQPYVDQIGNAVYGVNSEVATCQLYNRGGSVVAASGSIQAGNTGLCTIGTQTPHGFTVGQPIIIGCGWQTFPTVGYPNLPNSGAVFTGLQTVTNVVDATHFQFVSAKLQAPTTPWEIAAAALGVPTQLLNGLVAPLPTPFSFNLAAASGVILQRPIFSPSDLTVDLTSPDIAETLGILEALSPNGRIQGLEARFFNLTWDYSEPTPIPNFQVPAITGVFIDDATQQVSWNLASGLPSGYRIDITDPVTNQLYNQFTIDHPFNPLLLTQFQLSLRDFSAPRNITITPFDAVGNGVPLTIFHSGNGSVAGGVGAYIIHRTVNSTIQPNQILVRVPFDQNVTFGANMVPSQAWIDVPPVSGSNPPASGTDVMVFSIQRFSYSDGSQDIGVEFACLTFSPGTHIGVFTSPGAQPFNQGDVLKIIAQNVPGDGVGIGLSLVGTIQS